MRFHQGERQRFRSRELRLLHASCHPPVFSFRPHSSLSYLVSGLQMLEEVLHVRSAA
jgi:hypothetical protein